MSIDMVQDMLKLYHKYHFDKEEFDGVKLNFRMSLLREEYNETMRAYYNGNSDELVDGMIDLMVIIIGTLNLSGVNVNKAWKCVLKANKSKKRGIKKGRESSKGFDIIKPTGWKSPSHKDNLGILKDLL